MISVLVVDDSPTVRLMLRGWLSEAGYDVHEAGDGVEALDKLKTMDEHVIVLLDYQMPKLDGYGMLQRASTEGFAPPKYSYVVISGVAERFPAEFTTLLRQLGIQILPKPFDRETILHVTRFVAARVERTETAQ